MSDSLDEFQYKLEAICASAEALMSAWHLTFDPICTAHSVKSKQGVSDQMWFADPTLNLQKKLFLMIFYTMTSNDLYVTFDLICIQVTWSLSQ